MAVIHSFTSALAYSQRVTSEGHCFHQLFYLHPKLYVHEKCATVFAKAYRGRSNFCSLTHANLCRWHHYCWKMDCLIKHIIWHICCLADQIEVVFLYKFLCQICPCSCHFCFRSWKVVQISSMSRWTNLKPLLGMNQFFPQGLFHSTWKPDRLGWILFFH